MSRRFALIANPTAGGGKALEARARALAAFRSLGAECRSIESRSADQARAEARAAAAAGEVVVAVGGDGLVRECATVLRGGAGVLAVIPGGRGNDFARVLEIPREPDAAARLAVEGVERQIDLASANGATYVGIASLGFDSDANRIANEARFIRGNLVYLYAALRALSGWRMARFEVVADGVRREFAGYSVAVANSKVYGGGMFLVPHAQLDDGELDVFMCGEAPKLRALRGLTKVFKGTHVDEQNVSFDRGKRIEISADRPFDVYADGDPIAQLPVEITVDPGALRVIAPPAQPPASA